MTDMPIPIPKEGIKDKIKPLIDLMRSRKKESIYLLVILILAAAALTLSISGKFLLPVQLRPKAENPQEPSPNCRTVVNIAPLEVSPSPPAAVKKGLCEQCLGTYDCQTSLGCWPCGSAVLSKCAVSSCNECVTPTP